MKNKIKLYLLTGFLGAGKTTLLKNLLDILPLKTDSSPSKAGIIVNEFGKISIDGPVIEKDGLQVVEINNGSVFCKCLEGSFIDHVAQFKNFNVDFLFVESSGLSDPANMESIISQVNRVAPEDFSYEGSFCVVDAKNILKLFDNLATIKRQINYSNIIILNKVDLVDREKLAEVTDKIREINPLAKIFETTYCRLDAGIFNEVPDDTCLPEPAESLNKCDNKPQVLLIKTEAPIGKDKLLSFIEVLKKKAVRIKGFVRTTDGLYHLDVVSDEVSFLPSALSAKNTEIVVIPGPGRNIKILAVKYWNQLIGVKARIE